VFKERIPPVGAPDFPVISSMQDQLREFYARNMISQIPSLVDDPEVQYGNIYERYIRLINEGTIKTISELDIPTRLSQAELDARYINNGELVLNVKNYAAVGDGVTSDATAFTAAFNASRTFGARVYIPKGTYYLPTTVDCSGIDVYGDYDGYQGANGSILKGAGSGVIFKQLSVTADSLTMRISGLRFVECTTGIQFSYCVYSHVVDVTVYNAAGPAIIMGDNTIIGPLFNEFHRVAAYSTAGSGLELYGKDWCNNNIFVNCDFKGAGAAAVKLASTGGYGAINNIFSGCELRGNNVGVSLDTTNVTTKFEHCYFENLGPAVWAVGATRDLQMVACVYGSLVNTNTTGKPNYIHHTGATTLGLKITGGWVTTGVTSEFDNLRLVGSDVPANLSLYYINEPRLDAQGAGFKLHDDATISAATQVFRGNLTVQKASTPEILLQYPDGTRPFKIRRNGTMGGSDFGVQLQNNGVTVAIIDNNNRMNFQTDIGTNMSVAATGPVGTVVKKLAIRDNNGTILGYLPIYDAIT
jgi:hypothetical protein